MVCGDQLTLSYLAASYNSVSLLWRETDAYHPVTPPILLCPNSTGPVAQRIRHLTTNQGIAGSSPARVNFFPNLKVSQSICYHEKNAPPGGLEPPTFRLTAERASRLRHGGQMHMATNSFDLPPHHGLFTHEKNHRRGWDSNPRGQSPLD